MKNLAIILILLGAPIFSYAFGPEVCEPEARAKIQSDINAYVQLAKKYPNEENWQRYLGCEGQPLSLVTENEDNGYMNSRHFHYVYSIQCGQEAMTFGTQFDLRTRCEVSGG